MTRKTDSVKVNFIFQILYQIVILVLPLVTAPYLTRILGDALLGEYTYVYSIAYYFVVFAMLGIMRHGQRIIAARRNDDISLRKTFWSLFFSHAIVSLLSILVYFIFSFFQSDKQLYFIMSLYVLSALFDLTWLFYGLENFKSVAIKNFIIKVIETALVFILVKSKSDLYIYAIIRTGGILLGQIILVPQAIKWVKPIRFGLSDVKEHIKPLLVLSISSIAATLYTVFDKTLLGLLSTKEDVAYYEYSNKIITIPKTIITVVGTVLFPRACACFSQKDTNGMKKYFKYALYFSYFIGFGSIFGLLSVSNLLALEYYGEEFITCGKVMSYMSPIILIIALGDIVRTQILIPMKKDTLYVILTLFNAIINITLSTILIPIVGIYGAIIGTISAEAFGTITQMFVCRKFIDFKSMFILSLPFILAGLTMFFGINLIKQFYNSGIVILIIQVLVGFGIYVITICICFLISPQRKTYISFLKKQLFRRTKNDDENDNAEKIE